jgi:hypothetical protein
MIPLNERHLQPDSQRPSSRVIELTTRRVQILGSTPYPEALFMQQMVRTLTMAEGSAVPALRVLICDRDRKWSGDVRRRLRDAGIRMVLIPERAPNANAFAENSEPVSDPISSARAVSAPRANAGPR